MHKPLAHPSTRSGLTSSPGRSPGLWAVVPDLSLFLSLWPRQWTHCPSPHPSFAMTGRFHTYNTLLSVFPPSLCCLKPSCPPGHRLPGSPSPLSFPSHFSLFFLKKKIPKALINIIKRQTEIML